MLFHDSSYFQLSFIYHNHHGQKAKKVLHTSNIYRIKPQEECAKKIVELSTYDMQCFFVIVEQKQMKQL